MLQPSYNAYVQYIVFALSENDIIETSHLIILPHIFIVSNVYISWVIWDFDNEDWLIVIRHYGV